MRFHWLLKTSLAVWLVGLVAATAAAQNNNNNNNGGNIFGAAGVFISPEGVFRVKHAAGGADLAKVRIAEAKARLGREVVKNSPLRKVSLNRLQAALAEQLAAGKDVSDEMNYLAGLTRLQYVFYYPESKDIVIAGPAEGFYADPMGKVIGMTSSRAVLELQDLIAALRAYPPAGKSDQVLGVSIDPTQEGLARMQQWLASIRPGPGDAQNIVNGLKEQLGLHTVSVTGVSPRTHFAQVMVEADYRMKLIGIGKEPPPVKMATYISRATASDVSKNALQRWYFTPHYDCVRVADDDLAMELVGQGVKLIGENELVGADGRRAQVNDHNKASKAFCDSFTANYPQIAVKSPVYGQLRNLIDLAVAAAFIQKQDYYGQADWKLDTFGDETKCRIETYETPKTVETECNAVWKGNRLMTPVGGGVSIEPHQAVQSHNLLPDEKGDVKQARESVKVDGLAKGQWWWD